MTNPTPPAQTSTAPRARLLIFAAVALAAFGAGFLLFSIEESRVWVKGYAYYTIAGTSAWAAFALARVAPAWRREGVALSRRETWQVAAVVAGCVAVALMTAPLNYKILYDEMVLQATASDMHIYRDVTTVVRAYTIDGVFAPLDTYLDKRPFFYPFIVSLVHDLTGYREINGLLVNVVLLPVILLQLYALARRCAGHAASLVASFSLGTLSTLVHSATGGGMETVNLAMLLLAMQLAVHYLDAPEENRLAALMLVTVLLAQSRYESSLFVVSVALVTIEGWRRAGRVIMPPAAMLAPLLLVPYAVHNTYVSGTPFLWELRQDQQTRFSLEHLGPNLRHAAAYFFSRGEMLTNSLWLATGGLAALGYATTRAWRHRRAVKTAPGVGVAMMAFGIGIGGNMAVLMCYYWGQLDDPAVARLALPLWTLLALCVAVAVDRLQQAGFRRAAGLAAAAAGLSMLANGIVANEQHSRRNTLGTEIEWECRFVEALPPGERLVISNKSALPWLLRKVPSISIDRARARPDALRGALVNHTFREILVSQTLQPTTATGDYHLMPEHRLPDGYQLEPVVEKRFGARLARISRLVAIKAATKEAND